MSIGFTMLDYFISVDSQKWDNLLKKTNIVVLDIHHEKAK